jgi:hypothetical protein
LSIVSRSSALANLGDVLAQGGDLAVELFGDVADNRWVSPQPSTTLREPCGVQNPRAEVRGRRGDYESRGRRRASSLHRLRGGRGATRRSVPSYALGDCVMTTSGRS